MLDSVNFQVPRLIVGGEATSSRSTRTHLARPPLAGEYGRLHLLQVIEKDNNKDKDDH